MLWIPLSISNRWEDSRQPHRLRDQHFGLGFNPESLLQLRIPRSQQQSRCPLMAYYQSWADPASRDDSGASTVKADKDQFQVVLDVQQFEPEEINVKVVDGFVVVEGKHEEKQDDHGWISRQFNRRYMIPEECDLDQVSSKLSSDGLLSITVPRKKEAINGERVIPIEQTGMPAIREHQHQHQHQDHIHEAERNGDAMEEES